MMDSSSHSEVEKFMMCERSHFYGYGEKLMSTTADERLIRGNVGHAVLQSYYQAIIDGASHYEAMEVGAEKLWTESELYKDELFNPDKFIADLGVLIDHYWTTYEHDGLQPLETEILHDVQLTADFKMPVKVDLIARMPGRGIVALDHKFVRDFYNVDRIDLNPQLVKYFAALRELGIKVDGVMYNELRTRETKDNKIDISEKFRRTPVILTPAKVANTMREQIMAARRISRLKSLPIVEWEGRVLRNPTACYMCDFTSLCDADLNESDRELVKLNYFTDKVYR